MARLFVAIELSDDIKAQLNRLKTNIPTARWNKPFQMHITLRFIGADVPEAQVEPIRAALADVSLKPFDLQLSGVGTFPKGHRKPPRVLWAGVKKQPQLHQLHHQVEAALEKVGFAAEDRAFSPHITLARFKTRKSLDQVTQFLTRHHDFQLDAYTIDHFVLYRSELLSEGPQYIEEQTFP